MTISILTGNQPKLKFISDQSLEILVDASLNESHINNNAITQFPVEDGSTITDHISEDPIRLEMTGFISNAPIKIFGNLPNLLDDSSSGDRVKTTYEALKILNKNQLPFTVVTGLTIYENMFFSSLTFLRTPKTNVNSLQFNAQLTEVRFVTSRTEDIAEDQVKDQPEGTKDQAQTTKDTRKQSTTTPSESTKEQSSFLFDGAKALGLI